MNVTVSVRDNVTPDLMRKIAAMKNKRPVLLAMGRTVVDLAKRTWDEPALRPLAWPARKKNTGKKLLFRTGDLFKGNRVVAMTEDAVIVGTHKAYAAVHQFGSKKKKGRGSGIPARPFWPLTGDPESAQLTPAAREEVGKAAQRQFDAAMK